MSTDEIFNHIKINERLSTGGQPTEAQIRAAAREGFMAVINLATVRSENALPHEGDLVRSLGMEYVCIPVEWQNPTQADFNAFNEALQRLADAKVLIHCQANFRVTAFYGLYAQKHLGWTEAQADAFRKPIWQGSDYPVWERFIQQVRQWIASSEGNQA